MAPTSSRGGLVLAELASGLTRLEPSGVAGTWQRAASEQASRGGAWRAETTPPSSPTRCFQTFRCIPSYGLWSIHSFLRLSDHSCVTPCGFQITHFYEVVHSFPEPRSPDPQTQSPRAGDVIAERVLVGLLQPNPALLFDRQPQGLRARVLYSQPSSLNTPDHRDDVGRPALLHGTLKPLFQVALYLPASNLKVNLGTPLISMESLRCRARREHL